MTANKDICVILRTYGGKEGARVKAGKRFSIGKQIDGMDMITQARFQQLRGAGLARLFDPDAPEPKEAKPRPTYPRAEHPEAPENAARTGAQIRAAARRRTKDAGRPALEPSDPKPITSARGRQIGADEPSSSSQAAPASASVPSKPPGTRRGTRAGSSSTTPIK